MPPTIVLVHGAFADSASWDHVIDLLPAEHRVVAAANPLRSLAADAESVSDLVRTIDGPVLLVAHSYGGVPVTEAGDHPAVEGIVYVAAFALDAGESVITSMGGSLPEMWGIADGQLTMGRSRDERVDLIAADMPPGVPREAS